MTNDEVEVIDDNLVEALEQLRIIVAKKLIK
jgi:hypothetical protein